MSQAQVEKFVAFVARNPAALQSASQGAQETEVFVANVTRYAREQGFDFTSDEARSWLTQYRQQSTDGELQDAQLEAVAGGSKGGGSPNGAALSLQSAADATSDAVNAASGASKRAHDTAMGIIGNLKG